MRGSTILCDGEEKKLLFRALRKRRQQKRFDQKWSNFAKKATKKRKKKEKKSTQTPFPLIFSSAQETHKEREREKALECLREKKKMSENIINNKQMTTRERQHIEVAKLEAELNALKVDAFAKVLFRCCFFFFFLTLFFFFVIIITFIVGCAF